MKKTSLALKSSLVGLTLLQALSAQAYFDKTQYLIEDAQFTMDSKKSLSPIDSDELMDKASGSSIERILDNVMGTINKSAKVYGPVYRHDNRNAEKYGDEVVKIILQAAHDRAKGYLKEGNPEAYYAFLALSLTVPNQEGLFVHFREVEADKDKCNDKRSNGENIKSEKAQRQFQVAFNAKKVKTTIFGNEKLEDDDSREAFLVDCKELKREKTYRQLIVGGSDGSDVGMFQLSALWHFDNFLNLGRYDSVKQTVEYGIKFLYMGEGGGGFRRIVADNPECIQAADSSVDYLKAIRGSWAAYNGGMGSKCRFADSESAFAGHDKGFKKNLQITLDLNDGGFFGFAADSALDLSPEVRAAVEEIVTNLEQKTNNSSALNKIIK